MKTPLVVTNLLTVGFIAWLFFSGNIGCVNTEPAECNTCTNICADYSGKGITKYDISVLDTMSRYYKNTTGVDTTPNIWFSLDTLKRFIWNIENGTCGRSCGKEKFNAQLGIRIYFAQYPDEAFMLTKADLQNVDRRFAKQQTLFMIPTFDKADATGVQHVDFDPTNVRSFDSKKCVFQKIENTSGLVLALGLNTTAQNHGGLCPPVCDFGRRF